MARYAKKNNFTDKIQQILPSKSVKNSGTLVDQDNPKNLLEKLILNTTHPSSQQALTSLTETFGSHSIMYRLLSEKISTHPPLHSSFTRTMNKSDLAQQPLASFTKQFNDSRN